MKRGSERDESIDNLLRSRFAERAAQSGSLCVDPERIAAWSEGTLPASEASMVEMHLATCPSCQEVLAVFARTEAPPSATPSLWQRWHLRWAVPLTAAATAIAFYVALPDNRRPPPHRDAVVATAPRISPESAPPPQAAAESVPLLQEKRAGAATQDSAQDSKSARTLSRLEKENRRDEVDTFSAARAPQATLSDANAAPSQAPAAPAAPAALAAEAPKAQNRAADTAERQEAFQRTTTPIVVGSPDPLVRWRILPSGRLERSTNAGQTWQPVNLPEAFAVVAVRATSATSAIAIAADGRQLRTDDQGQTWNPVQP